MLYSDNLRAGDAPTSYGRNRDGNDDDEPEEGEELDDTAARSNAQPALKGNYAGKASTFINHPLQLHVKGAASTAPAAMPGDAPPAYDPLNPQTSIVNGAANGYNAAFSRSSNHNGTDSRSALTGLSIRGSALNGASTQWPSHSPPLPVPPPGAMAFLPALPPALSATSIAGPARYERNPALSRQPAVNSENISLSKLGISIRGRGNHGEDEQSLVASTLQAPAALQSAPSQYTSQPYGRAPRPSATVNLAPVARSTMALPFKSKKASLVADGSGASLMSTPPSLVIKVDGAGVGGYSAAARAASNNDSRTYARAPSPKYVIQSSRDDVFRNLDTEPSGLKYAESSRTAQSPRHQDDESAAAGNQMYGASRSATYSRDVRTSSSMVQAETSSSSHHPSRRSEISVQGRARDLHLNRDRDRQLDRHDYERDRDDRRDRHSRNGEDDDRRYSRHADDDDRRYGRHGGDDDWDTGSPRYTHSGRGHQSKYGQDGEGDRTEDRGRYVRSSDRYNRDSRDHSKYDDDRHRSSQHRSDRHRDGRRRSRSRSRECDRREDGDNRRNKYERQHSPSIHRSNRGDRRDDERDDWLRADDRGEHRSRRPSSIEHRDETSGPDFHDEPGAPRHPSRELASDVSMNQTPVDGVRKSAPDLHKLAVLARMNAAPTVATPFFLRSPAALPNNAESMTADSAASAAVLAGDANIRLPPSEQETLQPRPQRAKHYVLFGSSSLTDYELEEKVGEGTFGVVHKARRKIGSVKNFTVDDGTQNVGLSISPARKARKWKTRLHDVNRNNAIINGRLDTPSWQRSKVREGQLVALKKIVMHNDKDGVPITALREIRILKSLDHPNIVSVIDMAYQPGNYGELTRGTVYMVFPYMSHDLAGLLENKAIDRIEPALLKLYARQLLEGTAYLHRNHILHRDMKAANLLVSDDGLLQIADFGLARSMEKPAEGRRKEYTNCVVTRWYRPPELLLGFRAYGSPVDVWGVGCVIGEMFFRHPIFTGSSDIDQVARIVQMCGSIDDTTLPGMSTMPETKNITFQPGPRVVYKEFSRFSNELADLVDRLLTLDPVTRLTAAEALDHDWFWTDPLPAEVGNVPKFPSSHEYDKRKAADEHQGRGGEKARAAQEAAFQGPNQVVKIPVQQAAAPPAIPAPFAMAPAYAQMVPMTQVQQAIRHNGLPPIIRQQMPPIHLGMTNPALPAKPSVGMHYAAMAQPWQALIGIAAPSSLPQKPQSALNGPQASNLGPRPAPPYAVIQPDAKRQRTGDLQSIAGSASRLGVSRRTGTASYEDFVGPTAGDAEPEF